MNPTLTLTFVHYPESEEGEPNVLKQVTSPVVPRIGDTVVLDETEASAKGLPPSWEVVDVYFHLPAGENSTLSEAIVYIDPAEMDEDEDL